MNSILVPDQSPYQVTTSYLSAKIQKQHQLLLTDTNYQYSCVMSHLPDRYPLRPKYRDRIEGRGDLVICNQGRWVQRVNNTNRTIEPVPAQKIIYSAASASEDFCLTGAI